MALSAVLGFVLLALRLRAGAIVATCSLAAVVVATLSPLGNMLLTPLEQRFPDGQYPTDNIEGIIVLGSRRLLRHTKPFVLEHDCA